VAAPTAALPLPRRSPDGLGTMLMEVVNLFMSAEIGAVCGGGVVTNP